MKKHKIIVCAKILFAISILLLSCDNEANDEKTNSNQNQLQCNNSVLLLKVDFLTNTFKGGKELEFLPSSIFTISHTYHPPLDFGDVQIYYEEVNEKIFDGTIIWMGTGERSYPTEIELPNTFSTITNTLPLPIDSMFENVMYDEFAYYPESIEYANIWSSIGNLEKVSDYRSSNSNSKINLFLYTPSVGAGNPADWDWYVILKN